MAANVGLSRAGVQTTSEFAAEEEVLEKGGHGRQHSKDPKVKQQGNGLSEKISRLNSSDIRELEDEVTTGNGGYENAGAANSTVFMPAREGVTTNLTAAETDELLGEVGVLADDMVTLSDIAAGMIASLDLAQEIVKLLGDLSKFGGETLDNQLKIKMSLGKFMHELQVEADEEVNKARLEAQEKSGLMGIIFGAIQVVVGAALLATGPLGAAAGVLMITNGAMSINAGRTLYESNELLSQDEMNELSSQMQNGIFSIFGNKAATVAAVMSVVMAVVTCTQGLVAAARNVAKSLISSSLLVANAGVSVAGAAAVTARQIKGSEDEELTDAMKLETAAAGGVFGLIIRGIFAGLKKAGALDDVDEDVAMYIEMGISFTFSLAANIAVGRAAANENIALGRVEFYNRNPRFLNNVIRMQQSMSKVASTDVMKYVYKGMESAAILTATSGVKAAAFGIQSAEANKKMTELSAEAEIITAKNRVLQEMQQQIERVLNKFVKDLYALIPQGMDQYQGVRTAAEQAMDGGQHTGRS